MLAELSAQTIVLVVLGGFLGGMASGAAGFAYGVVATSIWLHAISPVHAALLVVSGGLINQLGLVWTMRRNLQFGRLWPFLIGGAVGVPRSSAVTALTFPDTLRATRLVRIVWPVPSSHFSAVCRLRGS